MVRWPTLQERRISRRSLVGVIAGASVLGSRTGADLLTTVGDLFDVGVTLVLVYQTAIGDDAIGLHLSLILIGYLVYAYVPELYPAQYGDVITARGTRALTAVATVSNCVFWSTAIGVVPSAGAFTIAPETSGRQVLWLVGGLFGLLFVFAGYLYLVHGARVTDLDDQFFETLDSFAVDPQRTDFRRIQDLSQSQRIVVTVVNELAFPVVFVLPAVLLGAALAAINTFYPIPEMVLFVGILVSYAPQNRVFGERFGTDLGGDIEFRIADEITDAMRNLKGIVLAAYCILALANCGLVFVIGISLFVESAGSLVRVLQSGTLVALSVADAGRILVRLGFVCALLASPLLYGGYGFLYWYQQLRRLPAYAAYWEAYWRGEAHTPPSTTVWRPRGLFLPGAAILLLLVVLIRMMTDNGTPTTIAGGFLLAWIVVASVVYWSVRTARSARDHSLAGDGRAVMVALVTQVLATISIGTATSGGSSGSIVMLWVAAGLLALVAYLPEVSLYADRGTGIRSYTDLVYAGILLGIVAWILSTVATFPPILYVVLGGLLSLWGLMKYYEETVREREA